MEMQKTLGRVEGAVDTLTTEIREIKAKVTRFDKVLAIAGVVGALFLGILIWMANVAKDVGMVYMKAAVDQPKIVAPATSQPPASAVPAPK